MNGQGPIEDVGRGRQLRMIQDANGHFYVERDGVPVEEAFHRGNHSDAIMRADGYWPVAEVYPGVEEHPLVPGGVDLNDGSDRKYTMQPLMAIQAISTSGATAGWYRSYTAEGMVQSGFINTGTRMTTVHLPGMRNPRVDGINDHSYVAGTCDDTTGYHAFFQRPDGSSEIIDYPHTESGVPANSQATGINVHTEIVGGYDGGHGFFYNGGHWGLDVPGATSTLPHSINSHGTIAGVYCVGADCAGFTVNIRNDGHWQTFQRISVPGSIFTAVYEIIDNNELVGVWYGADGVHHSFVAIPTK